MLVKEKKEKINMFYCENKLKKSNSLLENIKKLQFSNKKDKNLSSNIDKIIYAK